MVTTGCVSPNEDTACSCVVIWLTLTAVSICVVRVVSVNCVVSRKAFSENVRYLLLVLNFVFLKALVPFQHICFCTNFKCLRTPLTAHAVLNYNYYTWVNLSLY